MRVDDDRVGALPAGECVAQLGADRRRPGVGGVDVQPDACRARTRPRSGRPGRSSSSRSSRSSRRRRTRPLRSSASGRSRNASSTGVARASRPRSRHAFSTEECACSEQTTTRASGLAPRAAASAAIVPVDAVSSRWPCRPAGSPSSCASQSSVSSSSSCSAGEVRQRIPTWFRPAISSSARMPGSEPVFAK